MASFTEHNPPFRVDHIGSLLRPPELLRARDDFQAGRITADALRAVEDEAIRKVVSFQEEVGLQVITDGEFRRHTYSDSFTTSRISGVEVELTEPEGWTKSPSHGHRTARPPLPQNSGCGGVSRIRLAAFRDEWSG